MKLPIGARLLAGFLAVIFLAGLTALVAIHHLSELSFVTADLAQKEIPEVHLLWKMRNVISGMKIDIESFIRTHGGDEHLIRLQRKDKVVEDSLVTYQVLHPFLSDEERKLSRELIAGYRSLQEATSRVISLMQSGEENEASVFLRREWHDLHQAVLESSDSLFAFEDREMEKTAALAQAKSISGRKAVIALTLVGTLLSLVLTLVITRSITKPVKKLIGATERAISGDLASKTDVAKRDEIGLLAQRFDEMMAGLNKCFEDQRRFFADASHELRTPLTILRGEAEVALREPEKPVCEYKETLAGIITLTGQMGRFVDELLFLSRSEAGQIEYQMAQIELAPLLLEEVYDQSKGLALLKGVDLTLDLSGPIEIRGDPQRLRQLFLILVDNGIKYTAPGGEVRITHEIQSGSAAVFVSDTGIGIPADGLPHIFERFYRVEPERPRSEQGTGLGLSIARSIVEAHEGKISVHSTLGKGTTFTVLLPRAAVPMVEVPGASFVDRR
ncbi:MAG: sensor histidine kinase [Candidatus Methylomirabilales bacterium]